MEEVEYRKKKKTGPKEENTVPNMKENVLNCPRNKETQTKKQLGGGEQGRFRTERAVRGESPDGE